MTMVHGATGAKLAVSMAVKSRSQPRVIDSSMAHLLLMGRQPRGGARQIQKFGPCHKALIKRRF
jgi:hypothetical protein